MMALVTGAKGFIGSHLVRCLKTNGHGTVGLDLSPEEVEEDSPMVRGSVFDGALLADLLEQHDVDGIFHLAGRTGRGDPEEIYRINVLGTAALLKAVDANSRPIRVLGAGTGAVYGGGAGATPLREDSPLRPATDYAVSKACADLMLQQRFTTTGLPTFCVRQFNVVGPGQSEAFLCPGVAHQLARVKLGLQPPILKLGYLENFRDFVDVRDAVRAMVAVMDRGTPGEAYNVASGKGVRVKDVVRLLIEMAEVDVELSSEECGPEDVRCQAGCIEKIQAHTGWSPSITVRESMRDILAYCLERERMRA
ncbi:MAG: GDP-mannose 4,6-dehydratase [Chloroflexi bacterium]|nr:GDP-mannose 4,6-dehydratase [Chloroflexota bacterium]